jgi:tetratricopeptide (TPR) repeat protein
MRALAWFEMLGMEEARRPKDHDLANTLITEEIEYARGLETTGLLADAERVYDSIVTYFGGLADTSSAVSRRSALVKDERFRAAQRDELRIDARERSTLNEISRTLKGLFEPEPPLPAQLIAMLRIEALKKEARGKGYEAAAAARTLELLSVQTSFYMPRDFERQKDHDRAARALEIAAAIRPDRPGVWLGLAANRVKALQMAPGFPEALEYRAEPYLALNRVDEAKNAYLELFASDRKQAAILIRALRDWVEKRRVAPEGPERPIDAVSFAASPACRATFPPGSRKNTECAFQWRWGRLPSGSFSNRGAGETCHMSVPRLFACGSLRLATPFCN